MREPISLADLLDTPPTVDLLAALQDDETLVDEVLHHRRLERALRVMLAPEERVQHLRDSITAAVTSTPLDELRETVLTNTVRTSRKLGRNHVAWAAGMAAILVIGLIFFLQPKSNALRVTGDGITAEIFREGQILPATVALELLPGDEIRTDEKPLTLTFADEATTLILEPETLVRVISLAPQKWFQLVQGGLDAEVAKQTDSPMRWTTDNAEARVLGTKFALTADGVFTRLDVERGAVELQRLGSDDQTTVRSGEFAATDRRHLLTASAVKPEPLWNITSRVTPGMEHRSFVSEIGGMEMGLNVLLPPQYESVPQRRFPVIFFLHDSGGDEHTEAARFGPVMEEAMARGMPPFIAVFPNIGPGHTPRPWIMGQVLARDLARYVDTHYRTSKHRQHRVVAGVGHGGHRALMWGAMQRRLVGSCAVFDGALGGGPPGARELLKRAQQRMHHLNLHVLLHSQAEPAEEAEELAKFLNEIGMEAQVIAQSVPSPAAPDFANDAWWQLAPELLQIWRGRRDR